jgi:hypothetical protein
MVATPCPGQQAPNFSSGYHNAVRNELTFDRNNRQQLIIFCKRLVHYRTGSREEPDKCLVELRATIGGGASHASRG